MQQGGKKNLATLADTQPIIYLINFKCIYRYIYIFKDLMLSIIVIIMFIYLIKG